MKTHEFFERVGFMPCWRIVDDDVPVQGHLHALRQLANTNQRGGCTARCEAPALFKYTASETQNHLGMVTGVPLQPVERKEHKLPITETLVRVASGIEQTRIPDRHPGALFLTEQPE